MKQRGRIMRIVVLKVNIVQVVPMIAGNDQWNKRPGLNTGAGRARNVVLYCKLILALKVSNEHAMCTRFIECTECIPLAFVTIKGQLNQQ